MIEITADGATKVRLNQMRSSEDIDAMPERENNNKHVIEVTPGGDVTMPEHHMRTEPRHQSPEKVQVAAKKPPSWVRSEPQQQSSWVRSEPGTKSERLAEVEVRSEPGTKAERLAEVERLYEAKRRALELELGYERDKLAIELEE